MAEQQQFYLLLGNLMNPDNNVRKLSEVSGTVASSARSFGGVWAGLPAEPRRARSVAC